LRGPRHGGADLALFHHPHLEPLPYQFEHPPVRDPPFEHQEFGVVDAAEVVADVGVEDVIAASRATPA
jgi:hypothetical protein